MTTTNRLDTVTAAISSLTRDPTGWAPAILAIVDAEAEEASARAAWDAAGREFDTAEEARVRAATKAARSALSAAGGHGSAVRDMVRAAVRAL